MPEIGPRQNSVTRLSRRDELNHPQKIPTGGSGGLTVVRPLTPQNARNRKRILLVGDDLLFRDCLRVYLSDTYDICGETSGDADVIERAIKHQPDLVLLMAVRNGFKLAQELRQVVPHCKLVMLSDRDVSDLESQASSIYDATVSKSKSVQDLIVTLNGLFCTSRKWQRADDLLKRFISAHSEYLHVSKCLGASPLPARSLRQQIRYATLEARSALAEYRAVFAHFSSQDVVSLFRNPDV